MERKQASDFPQELLDIFHEYVHGDIDRRAFFDRAAKFAVGGVTMVTPRCFLPDPVACAHDLDRTLRLRPAAHRGRQARPRRA